MHFGQFVIGVAIYQYHITVILKINNVAMKHMLVFKRALTHASIIA
jgi:hypothetical protein